MEHETTEGDHNGFVCAAFGKAIPGSFSPFTAECIALREGLTFVRNFRLLIHAVESDALNVITAVQSVPSLGDTSVVVDDARELLAYLNGPSHSHIRRAVFVDSIMK
ncbi:hypothetical protein TIFTF001_051087 [Ficus carica]|uniref:RNase H type-1 domain-containing protein n=1 Tax=Ficus carica TaxID=3494 RepID=A0AA87YRI0_FICCA|nr:hypothetical protein TIFTF001_051087 [Ficus carica]